MKSSRLELVRGLAAVVVLLSHLTQQLDGLKGNRWLYVLCGWGIEAVVAFFLLSGIVIHLSTRRKGRSAGEFLRARVARIVPLYLIAIGITYALNLWCGEPTSRRDLIGNLLFLQTPQGYLCYPMSMNGAFWSLSFEVFFYLVFALTLGRRQQVWLGIWFAVGVVGAAVQLAVPLRGWYGHLVIMFAFSTIWLFGYSLVDLARRVRVSRAQALAALGCVPMVTRLGTETESYSVFFNGLTALALAPLFLHILQTDLITVGDDRPKVYLPWSALVCAYVALALKTSVGPLPTQVLTRAGFIALPLLALLAGRLRYREIPGLVPFLDRTGLFLGGISYALYLIHSPFVFLVNGWSLGAAASVLAVFALVFPLATVLEIYVQPFLSGLILRDRAGRLRGRRVPALTG
jgi:peptidoglycan/LPS O-acetylase OafA/YrhL